jgi:hypothetical protein
MAYCSPYLKNIILRMFLFNIKCVFRGMDKTTESAGTALGGYREENCQINHFTGLPYTQR